MSSSAFMIEKKSMLARRIEQLGMTQREFAQRIGKSDQTVSNWVNNAYTPRLTPKELKLIAKVLEWEYIEDIPDEWGIETN